MDSHFFDVQDKIVLITGSSRGIGLAFAKGFLQAGSTVILNDIDEKQLAATVQKLQNEGYKAFGYSFNIADEEQVQTSIASIEQEVGSIDVLINNAGIQKRGPLEEISSSDWRTGHRCEPYQCFSNGKGSSKGYDSQKIWENN